MDISLFCIILYMWKKGEMMNKVDFIIEDCAKQHAYYYKRAVAGGYALPNYTKTQFFKDVTDLVCERKASGVRYLGKEEILKRVQAFAESKMPKFLATLN